MVVRFLVFIFICCSLAPSFAQKRKEHKVVVPQTQKDSLKVEGVLIDAEKYLMLEDYPRALESFKVALAMNTESAAINFKIAEAYALNEQGKEGLAYGIKAIELSPENKYYRRRLARIYRSVGFLLEAAKVYNDLLEKFPSDEDALYELAELYQMMGMTEEMFGIFDRIEAQLGVQEEIIREKQRIYMKQGKIDETIQEYEKLIDAYPEVATYRMEFISFLIQNRKVEMAEEAIKEIEETASVNSRVKLLKSELLWMKGDVEASLTLLSEAFESPTLDFESKFSILSNYVLMVTNRDERQRLTTIATTLAQQHPDEFKAQAFAGDLLFQINEKEQSLGYYLTAAQINPSNFSVWQNILNVEADQNNYDSVVVHAERALEYFPNQAIFYYFAGTGHMILKDYKKAVTMLNQGRRFTTDPNLLTIFYGQLGDAYSNLENNDKSFEAYENALFHKPDNDHVLNNYSYFLSLAGKDLDKAMEMSSLLVKAYPDNPTYLDTHGWVLYKAKDYKAAEKYLQRAAEVEQDGTILEHYGDVLFKLGKEEDALVQWQKASENGGASDLIEKKIADKKLYE